MHGQCAWGAVVGLIIVEIFVPGLLPSSTCPVVAYQMAYYIIMS